MRSADPPEEVMQEREQRKAATLAELRALDAQPFAPPGGLSGRPWRDVAFPLLMATLRRFHPSKSDDVLIPGAIRGVMECDAAWIAYRAGAAGALFDVMAFCELWELPMHGSAAAEVLRLMGDALRGVGRKKRGQQAHPMSKHKAALVKRLRYEHVKVVLREGEDYAADVHAFHEAKAQGRPVPYHGDHERWFANRAAGKSTTQEHLAAVALARARMPAVAGAKAVTDQALYRDWLGPVRIS